MRTFGTGILLLILALGWTATSHSFGFGDVFKTPKVEDLVPKVPPPPKTKNLVPKIPEPPKTRDIIPQAPPPPKADGLIPAVPQVPGVSTNLPAPKTPAQPVPPAQAPASGGLIGLGQSLGVIDKKTSKVLQTTTQTIKAFQPIGYEEEKTIGSSLALEVFSKFGGEFPNAELKRYLTLVGQSVAQVSDRPGIPYHFAILNTEDPNAFAAPGGYVFVSRGLLRLIQNEAQLAGVLGHEIAHVAKKHALKTLRRGKALQGIGQLTVSLMDESPAKFNQIIGEFSEVLFTRGLDKNLEYEADKLGTEYAYRMGYNPGGLKNFIRVLARNKPARSIFFSTHPSPRDRYTRLKALLDNYRDGALNPVLSQRFKSRTRGRL